MIFGKPLSAYVAFAKVILLLIVVVGVARLALSLAGVENATVKWLSISIVSLIGLVYYSIRVHTSGFGSYKQLLALIVIQSVVAQTIIIAGIVIAILTGRDNIFSAPEYSGGGDGKTWLHAGAHLIFGVIVGSLLAWLIGSVILFITKKVVSRDAASA
ncbi:MAG TPA: hypothetical protein VFB82_06870 [Blastocatellia bacterium]|jgi:hypothetical protein|nr:hypothetical protein [Blastocatellia bacterium]